MTIDQAFADWFDGASNETAEGSLIRHWALLSARWATERAAEFADAKAQEEDRFGDTHT